jgi:polygalacturonase
LRIIAGDFLEILDRRNFLKHGLTAASALIVAEGLSGCQSLNYNSQPAGWDGLAGVLAKIVPPVFPQRDFSVLDFGAQAGGQTGCRAAFAAAIQACSSSGGGRVVVPSGVYLMDGPIHLLSNVNLYLEAESTLLFGYDPKDYLPLVEVRWQGIRCMNYSPLIYAYRQENIAVTGSGTIDGQTEHFWAKWLQLQNPDWLLLQKMAESNVPVADRRFGTGHYLRPTLFESYDCKNIYLQGVTIQGSPFWTLHPTFCTNVTIEGVTVLPGASNDDGCDPESCNGVLIKDCTFTNDDDNISIKAGRHMDVTSQDICTNIVVQNCLCVGTWNAYTMGSQTDSEISNVFVENCVALNANAAFYVKSDSQIGGGVRDVYVRNCQVIDCHHLLFVQSNYIGNQDGKYPPTFRNYHLDTITCQKVSVSAIALIGEVRAPIYGIYLNAIAIQSALMLTDITYALNVQSTGLTLAGKLVDISQ